MNLQGIDSYLLSIQYGHLSLAVWPQHAIYRCFSKTDDLEKWGSRSIQVNVRTDLNSQYMGSYLFPIQYGHLSLIVWPQHAIYRCFTKWMTLKYGVQGQSRSNVRTDLNSDYMGSYLLSIQYVHLSLTVWPQRAIYCCSLCPKTDDLEIWGSRSSKVKCKNGFELAVYGFLFAPHTIWALISGRLATTRQLPFFPKNMTLKNGVQGHPRSNVRTDLNSQYMVSYLVPVQYMHLSLTIWPQRAIYCCSLCPKTDDLEIWGSRSSKVKCKDGFELAAYGFLFTPHTNNGVICYCFWDIQHFHLHGKPYSDPQFWGFLERKAPKMLRWKILTPKSIIYPRIRVFWAILRLSSPPRLVWARVEEKKEKKVTPTVYFTPSPERGRCSDFDQTWQYWWVAERNHPISFSSLLL